jgi:hypothetical protein
MRTSIVIQTVLRRHFCAVDVSVVSGHARVRLSSILGEGHMVRPDKAIVTVANFGAPAEVYTRHGEDVDGFVGYPSGNGQFQSARDGFDGRHRLRKTGNAIELDIEMRGCPLGLRPVRVRRGDSQTGPLTARSFQTLNDPILKPRRRSQYGLETRSCLSRAGSDAYSDSIERKHILSAPCGLNTLVHAVNDRMQDLQRFA